MVLYTPNNRIFNNRLECKKALNINCSQYKKLMEHQQGKLPYKARKDRRLILTSWQRLKVTLLLRAYAFFTKT